MKKNHRAGAWAESRTTYEFTDEEVMAALTRFVEESGETIPEGRAMVWVRLDSVALDGSPLATLCIDHPGGPENLREDAE